MRTTVPQPQTPVTLARALDELLELTEQRVRDGVRSAATLEMQGRHKVWWERELGPDRDLAEVDELLLDQVATRPRPRPAGNRAAAGPATLRKYFSTLKAALELQHRRRRLGRVPALPQILAPWRPRRRYLRTYAEARALFESLPPHRALWFWLCLWTGQHASDVERMVWADVDLHSGPSGSMLIRNSKNRKPELRVRMPGPLAEVLRAQFERVRPRPTDVIVRPWPSRKTTLPAHCRKLGLPELNAIDLRHTILSWGARTRGITPALMRFAGHSSPAMMARTYAHALPPQLEEVTSDLESMATPWRPPVGPGGPKAQPPEGGGAPST